MKLPGICLSILLIAAGLCRAQESAPPLPPPVDEPQQAFYGGRIQRSMTLLATSSKERRWPVRVLIYGQSITGSTVLTGMIEKFLRERFPYADLQLENRSIGGFNADRLVRTAWHDLYPFYPDLLIFHVYGGEKTGDLERLLSNVRRYTTADIVLFNHHQTRDRKADLEFAPKVFRALSEKYNFELVEISTEWPAYLEKNNLDPARLLRDNVHPNQDGLALLTTFIGRHLRYNPLLPAGSGIEMVRTYEAKRPLEEALDEITFGGAPWELDRQGAVGRSPSSPLRLRFEGNRVDIVAAYMKDGPARGTAKILIDGKPPSQDIRAYAVTLPSRGPQTWFPCIRRVTYRSMPLVEDWTLRITEIDATAVRFRFEVTGSKTGPDGAGNSWEPFVSKSGRVVIEPRDWMLADIMKIFKQTTPPPVGYEVKWSVKPMHVDEYRAPETTDPAKVYVETVAQGLTNGPHMLEVVPNGDGVVPIESIQVYRPPMK